MGGTADKLATISGVSVEHLRRDLKALRNAVGKLSAHEWDRAWMTAAEAAKLLGMDIDAFEEQSWVVPHVDFPDFGRRYQRGAVEEQLSRKARSR